MSTEQCEVASVVWFVDEEVGKGGGRRGGGDGVFKFGNEVYIASFADVDIAGCSCGMLVLLCIEYKKNQSKCAYLGVDFEVGLYERI